jgi:hypothetical protein
MLDVLTLDLPETLNKSTAPHRRAEWRHRLALIPDTLTVEVYSTCGGGVPEEVWNGRVISLGYIPDGVADTAPIAACLQRHIDKLRQLATLHAVEWVNGSRVGTFSDHDRATDILYTLGQALEDASAQCPEYWDASEWLAPAHKDEIFPAGFVASDANMHALALQLVRDARGDVALDVDDVEGALRDRWGDE